MFDLLLHLSTVPEGNPDLVFCEDGHFLHQLVDHAPVSYTHLDVYKRQVKGQERFDGCIAPHSHLICTCCGAVMDLPHPMLDDGDLDQTVSAQYGFLVQRHGLIFYGTCENCQNKIKQEEKLS